MGISWNLSEIFREFILNAFAWSYTFILVCYWSFPDTTFMLVTFWNCRILPFFSRNNGQQFFHLTHLSRWQQNPEHFQSCRAKIPLEISRKLYLSLSVAKMSFVYSLLVWNVTLLCFRCSLKTEIWLEAILMQRVICKIHLISLINVLFKSVSE